MVLERKGMVIILSASEKGSEQRVSVYQMNLDVTDTSVVT